MLLGLVAFGVSSIVDGVKAGSEGTINVETKEVVEVKADTTAVVVEKPIVIEEEVKEAVEEVVETVFVPLSFDKLKDLDGRQVKLEGVYSVEKYGIKAKKGVIVNGDLYFVAKKQKYVIHGGELIKIDGVEDHGHDHAVGYTCPEDDFALRNTYETEYCVGLKCRTRDLYVCSVYSEHKYWIYR